MWEHDVGDALPVVANKLPDYLRERIPELQNMLTELTSVRGPAMYGYEREGIPASRAFGAEYAREVFSKVSELVQLCADFIW